MYCYLCLILCSLITLSISSELPVCIVGAGASGLSAAHALEALGRSTVIFEEKDAVGGNAQNYYESGLSFYLGPLLIHNGSHPETMKIVSSVNVPTTTHTPASSWLFNWTTGETWESPPQEPTPEFLDELQRYSAHWERIFARFAHGAYTENVPDELTVSTSEWFAGQNYPQLQARLTRNIISWGYGDVDEVPIFYMLSVFTPAALGQNQLRVDFHEVFDRYSRQLVDSTIYLGSKIESIDRTKDNVTIHYSLLSSLEPHQDGLSHQTCSDVIIAFPPNTESLENAGLELTPSERTVFSAVRTTNYFSSAISLNLPRLSLFQVATESPNSSPVLAGEPVYIEGRYNTSDISCLYSVGRPDQPPEQVAAVTLQTLSRINYDPSSSQQEAGAEPAAPVDPRDVKAFRQLPYYFPHFDRTALQGGWYDKFNSLQGENRTYYTSGLNRVEHVEYVIVSAREVVEAHFSS